MQCDGICAEDWTACADQCRPVDEISNFRECTKNGETTCIPKMRPCNWQCPEESDTLCLKPTTGTDLASSCRQSPTDDKTKPACQKTCVPSNSLNNYVVCNEFCVEKESDYYNDNNCVNSPQLTMADDITP